MNHGQTLSKVVLISSGPSMSLKVLYCLRKMGLEVDLVDIGAAVSAARFSRYRRRYIRYFVGSDCSDLQAFRRYLASYIASNGIGGVVASDIRSTGVLNNIQMGLGDVVVYPTSSAETLDMLDDKWRFQRFMEENKIPCPRSHLITKRDDLARLVGSGFSFPVVVKSLYGESSHGVMVAGSIEDIERHLERGGRHAELPLVIQEYIDGYDADVSVLAKDGEVISYVVQSREDPALLEFIENEEIVEIARNIIRISNYTGVANIDVRVDRASGSIKVLECNPRFWYTLYASLWRGINFLQAGFAVAQGKNPEIESVFGGGYYRHGYLIKKVLWSPSKWKSISLYNLLGLLQTVSDPIPFVVEASPWKPR